MAKGTPQTRTLLGGMMDNHQRDHCSLLQFRGFILFLKSVEQIVQVRARPICLVLVGENEMSLLFLRTPLTG